MILCKCSPQFMISFQMLNSIDHWGVDIFTLASLTNNRPLTTMTYKIFQVIKLITLNAIIFRINYFKIRFCNYAINLFNIFRNVTCFKPSKSQTTFLLHFLWLLKITIMQMYLIITISMQPTWPNQFMYYWIRLLWR